MSAAILVVICTVACQSASSPHTLPGAPVVAVLPFSGKLKPHKLQAVRQAVDTFIQSREVLTLEPVWLDVQLTRSGHRPWDADWDPEQLAEAPFASWGADYVMLGTGFSESEVNLGVAYRDSVSGRVSLRNATTGKEVWSKSISVSSSGGVLLESGQALRGLRHSLDRLGNAALTKLAADIAAQVLESFPDFVSSIDRTAFERPSIASVEVRPVVTAKSGAGANGYQRIEVTGTPECLGFVTCRKSPTRWPLFEREPGRYDTFIPATGTTLQLDTALLSDRYGRLSRAWEAR